ncbi:MAG: hypothetical protein K6F33_00295 [Bacteroidales bacterium]|nr:hypothetical protein [Bacteroidales bacterium]
MAKNKTTKPNPDNGGTAVKKSENYNEPTQVKVERYLNNNYDFRWNTVLKDCFYKKKAENVNCYQQVKAPVLWRELQRKGFKYSATNLEYTLGSDFVTEYDPIKEYFEGLPSWDGKTDYIRLLCSHIVLVGETDKEIERLYTMFQKWLVRCIRCALGGRLNREVIMFKSDGQRIGKTEFFRYLTRSTELGDYYMENPEIGNKDALVSLTENLIINFDEYDKYLREGDLPKMKSYISQDSPKVRLPYGRKQEKIKRICSFVATTNIPDFLRDETGNTRFICFDVLGIEWEKYTKIDVSLIWGQAYHLYKLSLTGAYNCEMTDSEVQANNLNNLKYLYHSSEYELIQKIFEPSPNAEDFMTTTDIADYLHDNTRYKSITTNAVGRALTAQGYKKVHSKADNAKQGYQIRPKNRTTELFE